MLKLISRKRTPDGQEWVRSIVTVDGDTPEKKLINSLEIGNYPRCTKNGEQVIYTPIESKLYLLSYMMVVHEKETTPTVQQVLDAFLDAPADIQKKAFAFEFHHGFYDFAATDFFDLEAEDKWVSFVALLTEEDTGKKLPGVKLHFDKPIGINNEQWDWLCRKYSNPFYGYVNP